MAMIGSRAIDWFLNALIFLMMVISIWWVGPLAETRLYPVVSPLTITKIEPAGPDQSRIMIEFEKYRNCPPIGVFWYNGRADGVFSAVKFTVETRPVDEPHVNRPLGKQTAGPWLVDLPPDQVLTAAFVETQHQCHPLWPTVSKFGPTHSKP